MHSSLACRFAVLASRMEQYIQGQSRDLIDKAYTKLVSTPPPPPLAIYTTSCINSTYFSFVNKWLLV